MFEMYWIENLEEKKPQQPACKEKLWKNNRKPEGMLIKIICKISGRKKYKFWFQANWHLGSNFLIKDQKQHPKKTNL